ncbi:substrate-binding domain-containing protein, partial [Streptomyces sp. SID3343]|uniref:substrate-binding domain-containing protein n=1 Tax=Streptomyces sp. SID3343 TaxID=2690260 RepID=UPI00136E2816
LAGYRAWCADRGLEPITEEYEARTPGAGRQAADRLLDHAPDAVFGLHEGCAAELLTVARARDLRVPEDLLLACCGEGADPSITTLSLQPALAGAWAVELLVGVIEDADVGPLVPAQRTVPTRLSVRNSSTRG